MAPTRRDQRPPVGAWTCTQMIRWGLITALGTAAIVYDHLRG